MTDEIVMNQEGKEQGQEVNSEPTPGAQLKAARESKGLSLDEVSKSLYMTRSKLCAIEEDDYDELNSEVFVQGYLRKYGPLVGLDGDDLVKGYQSFAGRVRQTVDSIDDSDNEIPQTLVPKFVVPAVMFGFIAVVLISMFIFSGDDSERLDEAELVSNEVVEREQADAELMVEDLVEQVAVENIELTAAQQANARVLPVEANDESSAIADGSTLAVTTEAVDQNAQTVAVERSESLTASELKFEFSEDCWIEVRDRIDDIIFTDIAKAGQSIELQGEAPFSISLGNAQAVTLYWGGEVINTQPRPGYRTAKIVVGE